MLTTDVYLPVLPRLGRDLHTSNAAAAATVSAVLVGIAVGQIVIGPLSDAVGRRTPLLVGAFGYAALHLLAAVAPTIATAARDPRAHRAGHRRLHRRRPGRSWPTSTPGPPRRGPSPR